MKELTENERCVWKKSYLDFQEGNGTTADGWTEKHRCAECDGYKKACKEYVPLSFE